jgi:hypothetical protein
VGTNRQRSLCHSSGWGAGVLPKCLKTASWGEALLTIQFLYYPSLTRYPTLSIRSSFVYPPQSFNAKHDGGASPRNPFHLLHGYLAAVTMVRLGTGNPTHRTGPNHIAEGPRTEFRYRDFDLVATIDESNKNQRCKGTHVLAILEICMLGGHR